MTSDLLSTPKMGFGCMRLPLLDQKNQKSIDIDQFELMVDAFLEGGGTYFDTARVYHEGASEGALRRALVKRHPRDSFTIATKCLAWAAPDEASAKADLETSLEQLGVDYIDYYLLHNVGGARSAKFDEYGMWDFLAEKKAEGLIRAIGFSMHDGAETLDTLLGAHPNVDFVQLQVNYLDWENPVTESRLCMEVAARHNVPVTIMEPARGGNLVNLPTRAADILRACDPDAGLASWAYRFCWNLPGVLTVLSGMSSIEQTRENMAAFKENKPFSAAERDALRAAVDALNSVSAIPCTNCRYCMKGCPQHVQIPAIMNLLNLDAMLDDHDFVKGLYTWQAAEGRASECVECGACEKMCPQKIGIIDQLKAAVAAFE